MTAGAVVEAPLLLTPTEAAEALQLDVSELRAMRAAGVGPEFHDVGRGLIRYVRASVEVVAVRTADRCSAAFDRQRC